MDFEDRLDAFCPLKKNLFDFCLLQTAPCKKKSRQTSGGLLTSSKWFHLILLYDLKQKQAQTEFSNIIIQKQEIKNMKLQSEPYKINTTFIEKYQQPKIESNNSLLIRIKPYFVQGKIFILAIKGAFQIILLLISLFFYLNNSRNQAVSIVIAACESYIRTSFLVYRTVQILIGSYIVSILAIQNIVVQHFLKIRKYRLLQYVNRKLDSLLIVGLQLNMGLSALILLIGNQVQLAKMISFALACLISLFVDGFMQCTGRPSDVLCTNDHKFIVILRVLSILNLILNISKRLLQLNQILIIGISIVSCIIISSSYIQSGYRTYRNTNSKKYLLILVTLFISTAVIMMFQYLSINSVGSIFSTFAAVFVIIRTKISQKNTIIDMEKYELFGLKNFQDSVSQIIESGQIERNSILLGLIQMHKSSYCSNLHCFTYKEKLYCPEFDCQVNLSRLIRYDIIIKYLVKCLYQQLITKSPENAETVLSYCQYSYYQMKSILPLAIHLHKLERMTLSLYQRMRLYGLKLGLKQDVKKMNPIHLNNDIEFEKIVAFDEVFFQVAQTNAQSIEMNRILWERLSQPNIEIHTIITLVEQINENRKKIENYWVSLLKYIDIWPHIKRIYAFYCLFLTNTFKKQREIKGLGQIIMLVEKKSQISQSNSKSFIAQSDAFNQNSIVIHNILQREMLVIKKCSKSIEKNLGYRQDQLKLCELSLIMPKYFRIYHNQKFDNWMDQGLVNLQKFYKGVDLFCVDKVGIMVSIVKTFKLFVNQSNEVEFVCLLLISPGQQSITAICDLQTNTIEEVTSSFLSHLQIKMIDIVQRTENITNFIPKINDLVCQLQKAEQSSPFQLEISSSMAVYSCIISRVPSNPKKYQINLKDILPKRQYLHGSMEFVRPAENHSKTLNKTQPFLKQKPQKLPSNIFMKEQDTVPKNSLKQMRIIKYTLHTFVTLLLIMFVITMLISNQNYISLKTHVEQHLNLIIVAKQPLLLGIKYYEAITGFQRLESIDFEIERSSAAYKDAIDNDAFLKTLFDASLFPSKQSQNIAMTNESSETMSNVDIFYIVSSSIASLKSQPRSFQDTNFNNFNKFILYFYKILNETKCNMHQSYSTFYRNIEIPSIIFIQFQCGLFLLVFSITTYNYLRACRKMKEIFKIMVKIDQNELKRIKYFWNSLGIIYSSLSSALVCKSQEQINNDFCKKRIKPGKRLKRKERMIYLSAVFSLLLKFIITGTLQIYISAQIIDIQSFGSLSSIYFDSYPSNLAVGYGMIKKYCKQSQNFTQDVSFDYSSAFDDISKLSRLAYIPTTDLNSPFYSTLKNYYFGNPCQFNPQIIARLNITERDCTINGGLLANGIVSYSQSIRAIQEKYLNNQIILSKSEIYNQTKWAIVANNYVEDLINLWGNSFIAEIESARTGTIYMYCSMFVLVMVIHYVVAHKTFLCSIDRYYQHYVKIYDVVVSKDRSEDKIVKSQLMSYSFIGR